MNLHQFVVITKDSPYNHTREQIETLVNGEIVPSTQKTANTKTVCHFQEYQEDGSSVRKMIYLEDLPQDIQDAAMALFGLVVPYALTLEAQ